MRNLLRTLTCMAITAIGTLTVSAQNCTPTVDDYKNFPSTKTLVVLDDNMFSDFNMAIKKDIKNNWSITETAFITKKEFEKKRTDPQYSFLLTTTVTYPDDKTKTKYLYFSLIMGKNVKKVKDMPDLISVPLAYASVDEQSEWVYKLPVIIRFMLKHVETMTANPKLISETPLLMYNKYSQSLANKTLYLVKEDLEKGCQTESAIKSVYPYKFKLVSESEVRKALEDKDDNVVILHKIGPKKNFKSRCYKMLMGAGDASVYYFDYHTVSLKNPDALLEKDLKKIGKQ